MYMRRENHGVILVCTNHDPGPKPGNRAPQSSRITALFSKNWLVLTSPWQHVTPLPLPLPPTPYTKKNFPSGLSQIRSDQIRSKLVQKSLSLPISYLLDYLPIYYGY